MAEQESEMKADMAVLKRKITDSESAKKKVNWKKYIVMALALLFGGACGYFLAMYANTVTGPDDFWAGFLILLLLSLYVAVCLQIVIHEAGHLVFGLLTGYCFVSFRIADFMWIRENGRLRFRRQSIAGTGGQCLMSPPDMAEDGSFPVVLYNLGGSLMNLGTGLVCFAGFWLLHREKGLLPAFLLMMSAAGILFALINGIPIHSQMVDNDGYNALSLGKNPAAMRALWIQLKMNEQMAAGFRLRDMPQEWFALPSGEEMKNSMTAALAVFACNQLMDEQRFEEADHLMKELLEKDTAIPGLHRVLLNCDRIYCELVRDSGRKTTDRLLDENQKKMMKAMKTYLSVIRTEFTYALLAERDTAKAEKLRKRFEKSAKAWPYPGDVRSERELLETAERISESALKNPDRSG